MLQWKHGDVVVGHVEEPQLGEERERDDGSQIMLFLEMSRISRFFSKWKESGSSVRLTPTAWSLTSPTNMGKVLGRMGSLFMQGSRVLMLTVVGLWLDTSR